MPTYRYECQECKHRWSEFKPQHDRHNIICPGCTTDGNETTRHPIKGTTEHKVKMVWEKAPNTISDIDWQDGRTGEAVPMPSLGPNVSVSSRRQLAEATRRVREAHFNATDGEHTTTRPVPDGKGGVTTEKVTTTTTGVDLGEIVPVEKPKRTPRKLGAKER